MAGQKKDAKISVGVEGAEEAADKLAALFEPSEKAVEKFTKTAGVGFDKAYAVAQASVDGMLRAFDKLYAVDVGKSAQQFTTWQRESNRAAQFFNRDVEVVKLGASRLGLALGIPDEQAGHLIKSFATMTNDARDNAKTLEGLGGEALAAGRSIEEMASMGAQIHNQLGEPVERLPALFADARAMAESLGTTGGPRALQDSLVAASGALQGISNGARAALPLIAALGKQQGMSVEAQRQASTRLLAYLSTDTEPLRRQLKMKREDFYDPQTGLVKADPTELALRLQRDAIRRFGGREAAMRVMAQENNLGPVATAALFRLTQADVDRAKAAAPKVTSGEALARVQGTPEEIAERNRERKRQQDREFGGRVAAMLEPGHPMFEQVAKQGPLGRMDIEFGKTMLEKGFGLNRLMGLLQLRETEAPERETLPEQGRRVVRDVEAMNAPGAVPPEVGPGLPGAGQGGPVMVPAMLARPPEAPAVDVTPIADAVKGLVDAVKQLGPVQVVDSTGAPEGSISAYRARQTRQ